MNYHKNLVPIPSLYPNVFVQQRVVFIEEPKSTHQVSLMIIIPFLYLNASTLHPEIDLSQSLTDEAILFYAFPFVTLSQLDWSAPTLLHRLRKRKLDTFF